MDNNTLAIKTESNVVGQAETSWKISGWNGPLAPLVRSNAHCLLSVPTRKIESTSKTDLSFHLKSCLTPPRTPTSLNHHGYSNGSIAETTAIPVASYSLMLDVLSPQDNIILQVSVTSSHDSSSSCVVIEPSTPRENIPILKDITSIVPNSAADPEFLVNVTAFKMTSAETEYAPHFVSAIVYNKDSMGAPMCVKIPCKTFSGNDRPFVTLAMFKEHLPMQGDFRYFFQQECPDTKAKGQWEATEDNQELPLVNGKITAYLQDKNQSISPITPSLLPMEIPTKSSSFPYTLALPSEEKREMLDVDRFRQFVGIIKDDVAKMQDLAFRMQGVINCYSRENEKSSMTSGEGFQPLQQTVDESEAIRALQTFKTWMVENNADKNAFGCLAELEDICFGSKLH